MVTTAVSDPAAVGLVENLTVRVVGVAAVTLPTAPLVNVTKLSPAVVSKPKPWIVTVLALAARFVVLLVTTGMTAATCTGDPLPTVFVVTTAVKAPAEVGFVPSVTVSVVAVAALTVPTAPLLKVTVLFPAVVSNPKPLMVSVAALAAKLVVALVITGITEAT